VGLWRQQTDRGFDRVAQLEIHDLEINFAGLQL